MKSKIYFMAIVLITSLFIGCAKDGETGPTGPAGAAGNSNVLMFMFGAHAFTPSDIEEVYVLPSPATSNMIDSSLVLVYHHNNGYWYPTPGVGTGADYSTRCYTYGTTLYVVILNPDGTSYTGATQNFDKVKVIVAPSSLYKGSRLTVDFNNYSETMRFFHLEDK